MQDLQEQTAEVMEVMVLEVALVVLSILLQTQFQLDNQAQFLLMEAMVEMVRTGNVLLVIHVYSCIMEEMVEAAEPVVLLI